MDFVAIDVETANADQSSICQIGLAPFENGTLKDPWESLIDPEDYFDPMNVRIHGIEESRVRGKPRFPDVAANLHALMNNRVAVCHMPFDRNAIAQACRRYGLQPPTCRWVDSALVTRRAWPQFARSGYALASVCKFLRYEFNHHDALEDAKAVGHVLLSAMRESGTNLAGWLDRLARPPERSAPRTPATSNEPIARKGNPDGPLSGEVIVFTGTLRALANRREAAERAAEAGCDVKERVTEETTILVVGDQDIKKLAGQSKSKKHRTAEQYIEKGQAIRILTESDFLALIDCAAGTS